MMKSFFFKLLAIVAILSLFATDAAFAQTKEQKSLIKQLKKEYKMTKAEILNMPSGQTYYMLHNMKYNYCICDASGARILPNDFVPESIYRIEVYERAGNTVLAASIRNTRTTYFCDVTGAVLNRVDGFFIWRQDLGLWLWSPEFGSTLHGLLRMDGTPLLQTVYTDIKFFNSQKALLERNNLGINQYGGFDIASGVVEVPEVFRSARYDAASGLWMVRRLDIDDEVPYDPATMASVGATYDNQGQVYYAKGDLQAAEQFFLRSDDRDKWKNIYLLHIYEDWLNFHIEMMEEEIAKALKYSGTDGLNRLRFLNDLHCDIQNDRNHARAYARAYINGSHKEYYNYARNYLDLDNARINDDAQYDSDIRLRIYDVQETLMRRAIDRESSIKRFIANEEKNLKKETTAGDEYRKSKAVYAKNGDAENEKKMQKKIEQSDKNVANIKKSIVNYQKDLHAAETYYDTLKRFRYVDCGQ